MRESPTRRRALRKSTAKVSSCYKSGASPRDQARLVEAASAAFGRGAGVRAGSSERPDAAEAPASVRGENRLHPNESFKPTPTRGVLEVDRRRSMIALDSRGRRGLTQALGPIGGNSRSLHSNTSLLR